MKRHQHPQPDFKTITCFCPSGRGQEVLERLRKEKGISSAFSHHARGAGLINRNTDARPLYLEREMVTALVPAADADEIFRFIYFAAGIDQPHAGMVLMSAAPLGQMMVEPEIPDETLVHRHA